MHASAMPRIRRPGAAKLPLCQRETQAMAPSPQIP